MMVFGDDASLPPPVLTTDDGRRFRYQVEDPNDPKNMTGLMVPEAMSWLLTGTTASWILFSGKYGAENGASHVRPSHLFHGGD